MISPTAPNLTKRSKTSLPDAVECSSQVLNYVCPHCKMTLKRESSILAHKCKKMVRQEEFESITGQLAFILYSEWFRRQGKIVHNGAQFRDSKLFTAFYKFAKFASDVQLLNPNRFVHLMVLKDFPPSMWCMDDVYSMYMEFLDAQIAPLEQVRVTVDALLDISDRLECDISDVFSHIDVGDLISKIRARRLSPWLLLFSKKFRDALSKMKPEHRTMLESLIRQEHWATKIKQHMEVVPDIKKLVAALGI